MEIHMRVKIRYILLPLVVAIVVFFSYVLSYLGFFKPVVIDEKEMPAMHLLYKEHNGAYHKIAPVIEEVEHWATENKIDCSKSFGYYLDNPDVVEEDRLRSWGGCVIDAGAPLPPHLPEGFKTAELAAHKYVVAVFEGSPAIGPQRVYPRVNDYIEKRRLHAAGPVLEQYVIHSQTSMTTTYFFAVDGK
jgi:DNA gyrase inhibitor GyrI